MNTAPLISVIVPVYNGEKYIAECLDCIINQSLKDIEILVVNDGSEDDTLNIICRYAEDDKRITVLNNSHEGSAVARNIGMSLARGEYLSFLDADDIFDAQMLEKAYQTAEENNSDIVVFQYRELDTFTGRVRHNCAFSKHAAANGNVFPAGLAILREASPCPWNKLFRRSFIEKHQLRFQNLSSCNDFSFTKCALLVAERVHFRREELLTYRRHKHSISNTRYKYAENIIEAGKELLSFIEKHFPKCNYKQFYDLMLFHCAHEYRLFPKHEESRSYVKKVMEFLPLYYRIQFVKKIAYFRVKQCLCGFFHSSYSGKSR